MKRKSREQESLISEILRFTLIALLVVFPIRLFIAQPFIVSGSSMDPTFESGEYLIIDEISYRLNEPERGDVIIFRFPLDTSKFFIKRIIGLPEETVIISGGQVTIISEEHPTGIFLEEPYIEFKKHDGLTVELKESEYFVLGDNRAASSDSRIWGPLERKLIIGKAFLRLLPLGRASVLPGKYDLP